MSHNICGITQRSLIRFVWLCVVSIAVVPPCKPLCTGFVGPNVVPVQPSVSNGIAKVLSLRGKGLPRGPAMVYSPLRPSTSIGLKGLETFPGVPLDFTGCNRTSEFAVDSGKATTSSLYGQWRPTLNKPNEVTPEGLPKVAKGRFITQPVRESNAERKMGTRGRPRSKPSTAVKPELTAEFVSKAAQVLMAHDGKMDSNLFGQHWKQIHAEHPLHEYKSHQAVTLHGMLSESSVIFKVSDTDRKKVKMFELLDCDLSELQESVKPVEFHHDPVVIAHAETTLDASAELQEPQAVMEEQSRKRVGRPKGKRLVGMQPVASVLNKDLEEDMYSHVPAQGKARNSLAFDRRSSKKDKPSLRQNLELLHEEARPADPCSSAGDAVQNAVVKLYNSWAMDGRDVVMEATHGACVDEMIEIALKKNLAKSIPFTAIDAGCGNGWATRILAQHELCEGVVGIDAAGLMVERARQMDPDKEAEYLLEDVHSWTPDKPVDIVLANELLYLLEKPDIAISHMVGQWLRPGGRLIAGLDCYLENKLSHSWAEDLAVPMHCLSENTWEQYLRNAGLVDIELLRSQAPGPWAGTLIITGVKPPR